MKQSLQRLMDEMRQARGFAKLKKIYRWLLHRCMDCGIKISRSEGFSRGEVCGECFDSFNGLTIDELCDNLPEIQRRITEEEPEEWQ